LLISVVEKEGLLASPFYADAVIPVAGFVGKPEPTLSVFITKITAHRGQRTQILEFVTNELNRMKLISVLLKMVDDEDGIYLWEPYEKERHVDLESLSSLILDKEVNRYNAVSGFIKS
jgi:hypothetical protein